MGDYKELNEFIEAAVASCIVPSPDSYLTQSFVILNFWPIYVGFVLMGLTLTKCEWFYLLITITNYVDSGLNYLLKDLIGPADNFQPSTCILPPEQMPALAAQKVVALYAVGWFLLIYAYPTRPKKSTVIGLNFLAVIALFSRCYLRFSTPIQMIAGAGVGFGEACILCFLFLYMKLHKIDDRTLKGLISTV